MKNIDSILAEIGIEIPADQKDAFSKAFNENYKTVAEFEKKDAKITKLTEEAENWKKNAESAAETLKGFDGLDPESIKAQIADYEKKLEQNKAEYDQKIYDRDFADAVHAEFDKMKFTSESARKAVMAQVKASGIQLKEGKLYGFGDVIADIKAADPSAFVDEHQEELEQKKVKFTAPNQQSAGTSMTRETIGAIKDRAQRRKAIAENPELFI